MMADAMTASAIAEPCRQPVDPWFDSDYSGNQLGAMDAMDTMDQPGTSGSKKQPPAVERVRSQLNFILELMEELKSRHDGWVIGGKIYAQRPSELNVYEVDGSLSLRPRVLAEGIEDKATMTTISIVYASDMSTLLQPPGKGKSKLPKPSNWKGTKPY
jgi:hypothetical protein